MGSFPSFRRSAVLCFRVTRGWQKQYRQKWYSFVIAELKVDWQSREQWNKCHSSVIFGCGDVPVLWMKVNQMLYRTCFKCRSTRSVLPASKTHSWVSYLKSEEFLGVLYRGVSRGSADRGQSFVGTRIYNHKHLKLAGQIHVPQTRQHTMDSQNLAR